MMRRLLEASVVVTVALFALSALGAGAAPDTTAMTTAKVKGAGVSLKYPSAWSVVSLTKQGLAAQRKRWAKKDPKLAAALANLDVSTIKFYAIHVAGVAGEWGDVDVATFDSAQWSAMGGLSLAGFREVVSGELKTGGATLVDAKLTKVDGKSAYRTDATLPFKNSDGTINERSSGSLWIPGETSGATVIAVASSDDAAGSALINSVLATVHHI
jgi:hypothetical protein